MIYCAGYFKIIRYDMTSESDKVFVYGTLKRCEPNHHWLTDSTKGIAKFLSKGTTSKQFPLVIGSKSNIPFLLNVPNVGNYVNGEIYQIDLQMLKYLDVLEGYPEFYTREVHLFNTENGYTNCWVYLLHDFPDIYLKLPYLSSYANSAEQPYQPGEVMLEERRSVFK